MTDMLAIIRAHIGRRSRISRQEMCGLLRALAGAGLDLANDCMPETLTLRPAPGGIGMVHSPADTQPDDIERAARAWANACSDITCISVMPPHGGAPKYHGQVRYDDPGSMHPMHRAEVMFVSRTLGGYEYDQIGQMRRRAKRVLIVVDDPALSDPVAIAEAVKQQLHHDAIARRVVHLRGTLDLDPPWSEVLDDGTLQMRDPDDGAETRYQYRVSGDWLQRRRLPASDVGDCWCGDDAPPKWDDIRDAARLRGSLIWDYYEAIMG